MRFTPVLLQPRLLTIKNRWLRSGRRGIKEMAAAATSLLMMYAVYISTLSTLQDIKRLAGSTSLGSTSLSSATSSLADFDPAMPLGVLLAALFAMIYLSAAVNALGTLFMSKDLDLIISAPISSGTFLRGKALEVGISVSWMVCIFGLPGLLAFGRSYDASYPFMIVAPLLCLALFALAVIFGLTTALIFAAVLPSERGKPIFISLFILSLGGFLTFMNGFSAHSPLVIEDPSALIERATAISINPWLPSSYCAQAIAALLNNDLTVTMVTALESFGAISLAWLLMQVTFKCLYERGVSRARQTRGFLRIHSKTAQRMARIIFPLSSSATRAIMTKEYKVFSRDLTHTVQLCLLLAITFVYLYNYEILQGPSKASEEALALWQIFLLLTNMALGSLVITSICSRFVFPSVSLEGHAFWLMQAAPVSLRDMLKAKFKSWLIPVSCIGAVIFISGAMALNADIPLVLASCAAGIILCHGLVGLSIGLGALFSHFEWEHSTQISTSIGSFVFMVVSMVFLGLNMIPLGMMFGTYILFPEGPSTPNFSMMVLGSGLAFTYIINKIATCWALSAGARALQPK